MRQPSHTVGCLQLTGRKTWLWCVGEDMEPKSLCRWEFISTSTWEDCVGVPTKAGVPWLDTKQLCTLGKVEKKGTQHVEESSKEPCPQSPLEVTKQPVNSSWRDAEWSSQRGTSPEVVRECPDSSRKGSRTKGALPLPG